MGWLTRELVNWLLKSIRMCLTLTRSRKPAKNVHEKN